MNEVQKISDLKPISFGTDIRFMPPGVKHIVVLLTNSIKNSTQITRTDILNCYVDFVLETKCKLTKEVYVGRNEAGYSVWDTLEITKEEWCNLYGKKTQSLTWFQSNLGRAIVRGKILAIPIIEI